MFRLILFNNTCVCSFLWIGIHCVYHIDTNCGNKISVHRDAPVNCYTPTGYGSKATEADSAGRPSRSHEQKKSVSSRVMAQVRHQGVRTPQVTEWGAQSTISRVRQMPWLSKVPSFIQTRQWTSREWGASSGGSSSMRQADSTGGPGSSGVSLRATDVRP